MRKQPKQTGNNRFKKLFASNLVIVLVAIISTLIVSGCASSDYSTGFGTSTSTICQSCHDEEGAAYVSEEKLPSEEEQCILPVGEQRERHGDLLHDWKKSVVRDGNSIYVAPDGQEYEMSLTGTCLSCHSNHDEFCNQCHSYAVVTPDCWSCHKLLEGEQSSENQ